MQIRSRIAGGAWTEQAADVDPKAGTFIFTADAPNSDVEVQTRYRMTSGVYSPWTDNTVHSNQVTVAYGDVSGTPGALADINAGEGGKLSGIAVGADVTGQNTAKDTANVGGRSASSLLQQLDAATQASQADTTPPAVPAKPTITSSIDAASGLVSVQIAWIANSDADLSHYVCDVAENGGGYVGFPAASNSYSLSGRLPNETISAKIAAVDKAGNVSAFSAVTTATTVRDTTPPGPTQNISVTASLGTFFISWTNPSDADVAAVTIYEAPTGDFAGATIAATVNATPGTQGGWSQSGVANGLTRAFWTRAVDTSGNASSLNGPVLTRTPDLTMDASALTGTITSGQIGAGVIPSILASQSLSAVHVVGNSNMNDGSVVAPFGGAVAYNIFDGRLYRNTDGNNLATAWSNVITPVTALAGQIAAGQIAANAVTAGTIAANAATLGTVAAAAITSRELSSGSVTASKIAVVADCLNLDPNFNDPNLYNQVTANNTSGGTVSYNQGDLNGAHGWYLESNLAYLTGINGPLHGVSLYDGALADKSLRRHLYADNPTSVPIVGGKTYEISAFVHNASSNVAYVQIDLFKYVPDPNNASNPPVLTYTGQSPQIAVQRNDSDDGNHSVAFTAPPGTVGGRIVVFNGGQAYGDNAFTGSITLGNVQVREQLGGTMIVDGSITTAKLVAGEIDGSVIRAGTLSASAINSTDSLPGSLNISNTGFNLSALSNTASDAHTIASSASSAAGTAQGRADSAYGLAGSTNSAAGTAQGRADDAYGLAGTANSTANTANGTANQAYSWAQNPVPQINANSTQINPGLINISGGTTLANWRDGGDNSKIWGGAISANSISANTGTFGARNVQVNGLDIHYDAPSNSLVWGAGDVTFINDAGNGNDGFGINAGSKAWPGNVCYLWINRGNSQLYCDPNNNVGNPNDFQIGRWYGGTNYNITYGRTLVTGDHVQTSSITADKMNVSQLSSLAANLGYLQAGTIASPDQSTYLDFGNNYFRWSANQFQINSPGGVVPVFTWNGSSLQLRNVSIDGGTINAQSVNTTQLTVGGVSTDRIANNAVTNGDFVAVTSSFQGSGGVSVSPSNYTVDGQTYN